MSDNFALHAIIITKKLSSDDAQQLANKIANKNVKQYRETKNTYRFKFLPKTKFIQSSYKTKKVNSKLSLVYGELKPQFIKLNGSGLFDKIKDVTRRVVSAPKNIYDTLTKGRRLDGFNNISKNTLEKFGNEKIVGLTIAREPLQNWIHSVFNVVSFGKWNEGLHKEGITKLFHLSLVATLQNNQKIVIEKIDDVNINSHFSFGNQTEYKDVNLENKNFTLNELIQKTKEMVGDKTFFEYRSFDNNCFYFVSYLLKSVGLYNNENKKFVFTDLENFVKQLPSHTELIANKITDLGALWSRISGRAKPRLIK